MKHIIIPILFTLILSSCETLVKDFDIKKPEDKITIVGFAIADSVPGFYITKNIGLDEPEIFLPLKDAVADLYKNDEFLTNLSLNDNRWYSANDYRFEPGNKYTLKVSSNGYKSVTADFEVPERPEIVSVDTNLVSQQNYNCIDCGESDYLEFEISFMNKPETEEFFSIELKQKGKCQDGGYYGDCYNGYFEIPLAMISNTPYIETTRVYDDDYYNRNASEDANGFAFYFSDKLLQDGENLLKLKTQFLYFEYDTAPQSWVSLVFKKIDKEMFEYVRSKGKNFNAEGNPFVQPVSIYTNVENGLGLVSGYSQAIDSIDISAVMKGLYPTD
jgi:hypothetical protein